MDASKNYATKESPDLLNKAATKAGEGKSNQWIEDFADNEGVIYPVYVRKGNQLDLTSDGYDDINFSGIFDAEGNLIKESENADTVYRSLLNSRDEFYDVNPQSIVGNLEMYDDLSARWFDDTIRSSEDLMYATNDAGDLVSNEIVRRVYDDLGYDSVKINANETFEPLMLRVGDSNHTMVFNPANIRSKFAVFDPKKLGVGAGSVMSADLLANEINQAQSNDKSLSKYGMLTPKKGSVLQEPKVNPVLKYMSDSYNYMAKNGGLLGEILYEDGAKALEDLAYGTTPMQQYGRLSVPTPEANMRIMSLLQL